MKTLRFRMRYAATRYVLQIVFRSDLQLQAGTWDVKITDMVAFCPSVKANGNGNCQFGAAYTFENPTYDDSKKMCNANYHTKIGLQAAYNAADKAGALLRQQAGSLCLLNGKMDEPQILLMQHVKGIGKGGQLM